LVAGIHSTLLDLPEFELPQAATTITLATAAGTNKRAMIHSLQLMFAEVAIRFFRSSPQ
jgi:hypothetical protein